MIDRAALGAWLVGSLAMMGVGCGGEGPTAPRAPSSPRPALLDRFNDFRDQNVEGTGNVPTELDPAAEPENLVELFAPAGDMVEVEAGYIDGQIGPIEVNDETDHNLGVLETFGDESYLFLSIAAETDQGVGMFMMYIDDGFEGELFRDGVLAGGQPMLDEEDIVALSEEELLDLFTGTSVLGCSGESLGQIDWDQGAVEYELRAFEESDPQLWTVEVDATFIDPYTEQELHAEGSMQVRRPD